MRIGSNSEDTKFKVFIELVQLLYSKSLYQPALHFFPALIFFLIVYDYANKLYLNLWIISLLLINVVRIIDIKVTQNKFKHPDDFKKMRSRFACGVSLVAIIYCIGIMLFYPELPKLNQLALICLITAIIPSGLVSFVSDKLTYYAFVIPLFLPVIILNLAEADKFHFFIGMSAVIYFFIIRSLFNWNYNNLNETIYQRMVNIDLVASLSETNDRLEKLSFVDELTQLANRRHFDISIEKELSRANRMNSLLTLIIIDIDFFKQFNDTYGHLKGDECLKLIAQTIKEISQRPADLVARYGGEEICVILPDTDSAGAGLIANKIKMSIDNLNIQHATSSVKPYVTVSMGIATYLPVSKLTDKQLIDKADKALYKAKERGRNNICFAHQNILSEDKIENDEKINN